MCFPLLLTNAEKSKGSYLFCVGNEETKVVGTLRHTLDSGRLRLDLTQPRFEDSEA